MGEPVINSGIYSHVCRLCGETYSSMKKRRSRTNCEYCKERQTWTNAAPEPNWFPSFLPTKENGRSKTGRWTNYFLATTFLLTTALILGSVEIVSRIAGVTPSVVAKNRWGKDIPDVSGMNLQSAQDCLQSWGFRNLDSESLNPMDGTFQILDRNWVVVKQSKIGTTEWQYEEIVLFVKRKTNTDDGSTACPSFRR